MAGNGTRHMRVKQPSRAVTVPADLARALTGHRVAKARFDAMPPSHRREYIGYIEEAKKPECVACHVTGYEKPAAAGAALEGVQCEVCHGPGSLYKATTIMSKKVYEADKEAAHKKSLEAGLIIPTEETCKGCHNAKSPHYKEFDFKAMSEKIKHW